MFGKLSFWFIGFLLLVSCTGARRQRALLVQADSLVSSYVDSAWSVLQQVSPRKLRDEGMQAHYALLWTEASLRRGMPVHSDSLVQTAVTYYDGAGEVEMQARAHYWAGQVYRRLGEEEAALHHYLQAERLARQTEDKRFQGILYLNLAYLYVTHGLSERADSVYQLAGVVGRQLPDTVLWAESLCRRAVIAMDKGNECYKDVEDSLLLAKDLMQGSTNKQIQRLVTTALSGVYARMRNGEKALFFAKECLSLQADTSSCYVAWALLGEAYYWCQQYDSAVYYLRKTLPSTNYVIKADAYMRLADVYRKQGNADSAMWMGRSYSSYLDSIQIQSRQSNELLEAEQLFLRESENRQSDRNFRMIGWALAGALVVVVGLFGGWYWQRRGWLRREKLFEQQEVIAAKERQDMQEELQQSHVLQQEQQSQLKAQQLRITLLEHGQAQHKLGQANFEALQQEEFEHLPVYAKMNRIMEAYARYAKSEEKMTEEDWLQLEEAANRRWNGICLKLREYGLTPREICLCCLVLAGFKPTRLVSLFNRQRNFYYTMQKNILEKKIAGCVPSSSLKDVLLQLVDKPF